VNTQLFGSVIGSTVRDARTFFDAQVCSAEFSQGMGIGMDGPWACTAVETRIIAGRNSERIGVLWTLQPICGSAHENCGLRIEDIFGTRIEDQQH
jgi:hypothetical protein